MLLLAVIGFSFFLLPFATYWNSQAAATVTGRVFQDYNGNGTYDTSGTAPNLAIDVGLANITVTAYDPAGVNRGSTTTSANGTYSLSATGNGPYRIEFTNVPSGYFPSARSTDSVTGGTTTNAGSTVQFINNVNTTDVNLALNRPREYSQNNPQVAIPAYYAGSGVGNAKEALVTFPYNVNGLSTQFGGTQTDWVERSDFQTIGSTWGQGYQRSRKRLFTAAFLKRHMGLGPRGMDGVYVTDFTNFASPVLSGFDLQGLTPANGGSAVDLGTVTRTNVAGVISAGAAGDNQLSSVETNPTRDLDAFLKVGRTGYGNIAVEENDNNLWLVNLNQRALVRVNVSSATLPGTVDQYPFTAAVGLLACPNASDVFRPFALTFYNGLGYLGGVCDASVSQNAANLRAYVYSFNPAAVAATSITYTLVTDFPLNYTREGSSANSFGGSQVASTWRPWVTAWAQVTNTTTWSQPILSDIEFTANGNMEIGLIDRFTMQAASGNYQPVSANTTLITIRGAGDILHLCRSGASYVMEGGTGCAESDAGTSPADGPGGGVGNFGILSSDGPSGTGEFYYFDFFDGLNATTNTQANHLEITTGGLTTLPGINEVMTTVYDPNRGTDANTNGIFSSGIHRYSSTNGNKNGIYQIQTSGSSESPFGKGSSLGEIELLADPAPIEIGNRVWNDANSNGVQDPGEGVFAGVRLELWADTDGNGTIDTMVGIAVTDANGEYYFVGSTTADANTTDNIGQVNGGILPNTAYQVRVTSSNFNTGQPLNGRLISPANNDGSANGDSRDSDGTFSAGAGSNVIFNFTTGGAGENNHTIDFGFRLAPTAAGVPVAGRIQAADGIGIRNVVVTLTNANGQSISTRTGAFGYYRFDDVEVGQNITVSVQSKRFNFSNPTRVVSLEDAIEDLDFTADGVPLRNSKPTESQITNDNKRAMK